MAEPNKQDMTAKLQRVADSMFPVTSERKEHEHTHSRSLNQSKTYSPRSLNVYPSAARAASLAWIRAVSNTCSSRSSE